MIEHQFLDALHRGCPFNISFPVDVPFIHNTRLGLVIINLERWFHVGDGR
ncbi:hypothetical protein Hanom_Chr16g01474901 [Helianthus anomalus]